MGRGDKKSKKGKIWRGSYGVSRSRNTIKTKLKRASVKEATAAAAAPAPAVEAPVKAKRTVKKKTDA